MEKQQKQIDSVQKIVKTEMKSWSDVVNKNNTQNKLTFTTKTVKEAVRAVNAEEGRSESIAAPLGTPLSESYIIYDV